MSANYQLGDVWVERYMEKTKGTLLRDWGLFIIIFPFAVCLAICCCMCIIGKLAADGNGENLIGCLEYLPIPQAVMDQLKAKGLPGGGPNQGEQDQPRSNPAANYEVPDDQKKDIEMQQPGTQPPKFEIDPDDKPKVEDNQGCQTQKEVVEHRNEPENQPQGSPKEQNQSHNSAPDLGGGSD